MIPILLFLEELVFANKYQTSKKRERNIGFQLYFAKKMLQECLKDSQEWIENKSLRAGRKVGFPGLEKDMKYIQELIERIDKAVAEFPPYTEISATLEEKKFFEQIIKLAEQTKKETKNNNAPDKYIT